MNVLRYPPGGPWTPALGDRLGGDVIPKPARETSDGYLAYIHTTPCIAGVGCEGDVVAHHLISRGAGGSDYETIPLCVRHHGMIHDVGANALGARYGFDPWREAHRLVKLWFKTGGDGANG